MNLPVEVIDAAREHRCLVFVGSRFAAEAREHSGLDGYTGAQVARTMGWKRPRVLPGRPPRPTTPSVRMAAAAREAEVGRSGMLEELEALVGGAGLEPVESHRIVAELFQRVFTTGLDGLMEAAASDAGHTVVGPGEAIPDGPVVVRLRGGFDSNPVVTEGDWVPFDAESTAVIRAWIRSHVVLFVGYRPDEEEFELLFEQLREAYRAELPRCHLAVAQGRIEDYQWQRWVWKGLLLFTADPSECMGSLKAALE